MILRRLYSHQIINLWENNKRELYSICCLLVSSWLQVKFTLAYGDIDEAFYTSIEGVYQKAVGMIINSKLEESFQQRLSTDCRKLSRIGMGIS